MKITTLTADEMELKESGVSGIVVGVALVIAGVLAGIFMRQTASFMIWIALGLVVAGIAVVLFSSSITVNANKKSGQLWHEKKRLIGTKGTMYAIADVFRIETRKAWRIQNEQGSGNQQQQNQQPVIVAQSFIVFKDGRVLALDHEKTSSVTSVGSLAMMSGQAKESAMAAQVAQFLNVPFQDIAPPNMGSGVNINIGNF